MKKICLLGIFSLNFTLLVAQPEKITASVVNYTDAAGNKIDVELKAEALPVISQFNADDNTFNAEIRITGTCVITPAAGAASNPTDFSYSTIDKAYQIRLKTWSLALSKTILGDAVPAIMKQAIPSGWANHWDDALTNGGASKAFYDKVLTESNPTVLYYIVKSQLNEMGRGQLLAQIQNQVSDEDQKAGYLEPKKYQIDLPAFTRKKHAFSIANGSPYKFLESFFDKSFEFSGVSVRQLIRINFGGSTFKFRVNAVTNAGPPIVYTFEFINKNKVRPQSSLAKSLIETVPSKTFQVTVTVSDDVVPANSYTLTSISAIIKSSKLVISEVVFKDNQDHVVSSKGTSTYPISLVNSFYNQKVLFYEENTGRTEWIKVGDIIEYTPPQNLVAWGFNVQDVGKPKMIPITDKLVVKRKLFPDIFNATAFYHWHQSVTSATNDQNFTPDAENGTSNSNAQIEVNINLPLNRKNKHHWQFLSDLAISINFSPLGKATPYLLVDTSRSGIRYFRSFELLRNYYVQNAINFSLIKYNKLNKTLLHTLALDVGLRQFTTKVRTNYYLAASNEWKPDLDKRMNVNSVGWNAILRYENRNDLVGFDFGAGINQLFIQNGINNQFAVFRKDFNIKEGAYKDQLLLFTMEANVYFIPFSQTKNPSGFILRYRFYNDLNSSSEFHNEIMVGYAINLKSVMKY